MLGLSKVPANQAGTNTMVAMSYERANGYNYNAVKVFMPAGATGLC